MANPNFGTYVPVNSPDPDWITGWGKRPYNWQTSINIDRELLPNLVVNAGYFRTWYGNFMVTDNQRVTPADYSPYCVTVPTDARLPLSGQQLCGLYDINPDRFGQVDNLVTLQRELRQAQGDLQRRRRELPAAPAGHAPRSAAAGTSGTPCSSARRRAAARRPAPTPAT